jgi:glycosyltransferase involved in cell wall biosynthesis
MSLVSVIVPIYNLATYLFQCVDSISKQSFQNLEIILVDDGSSDNAVEICEFFRKIDPRVHLIRKANGGLVSARQAGINAASGDYVFYVDGDDWLDPDCLRSYVDVAESTGAEIVIGDYKREFLGKFEVVRNLIGPGFYDREEIASFVAPRMIFSGEFFLHGLRTYSWGKLFKRSLVQKIQNAIPNEVSFGEDAALIYPAICRANSIALTNYTYCNYRQRPNSILKSTNFGKQELNRVSLVFDFLINSLSGSQDISNFQIQLQAYLSATLIMKQGAFLADMNSYQEFSLFGDIQNGARVSIYNSGSFGQHVYKRILENSDLNLVSWLDDDHYECRMLGMPVSDPYEGSAVKPDLILAPSFDPNVLENARRLAFSMGLPAQSMRGINFQSDKSEAFIASQGICPLTFKLEE